MPLSLHHVLYGGSARYREDDPRNLLLLCGDGVTGCHGAFHGADENTRRGIGEGIAAERPDTIAFVKERLGEEQGRDYLLRRYLVTVP